MEDDRYQALQAFHRGGVEPLEKAYSVYGLDKTGTRPLQDDEKADVD